MNSMNDDDAPPNHKRFSLSPLPVASIECLVSRLDCIARLLLRLGFSDHAALCGRDAALDAGMKALESGKAESMSAERRAGWLWTLARRAALRAAEKETACVSLTYDPLDNRHPAVERQRPDAIAVRREFNRLPRQQKTAVRLYVLEGLTQREAAGEMGIKPSSFSRRLKAGLARLRKAFTARAPHLISGEIAAGR